jgi:hypothetical protein
MASNKPLFGGRQLDLDPRRRSTPRCVVDFYGLQGAFRTEGVLAAQDPQSLEDTRLRIFDRQASASVLECSTEKNLDAPAGTWTVTLVDRPLMPIDPLRNMSTRPTSDPRMSGTESRWADILRKDDLVVIRMQRPPGPMKVVMVGLVSTIPRRRKIATPRGTQRTVTISGQDLGALLLNAKIWYFTTTPGAEPEKFTLKGLESLFKGYTLTNASRADRIKNVLQDVFYNITKNSYPFYRDGAATAKALLGYLLGRTDLILQHESNFFEMEGPIWNFLRDDIVDSPWHEFFVDTIDLANISSYHPKGIEERSSSHTPNDDGDSANFLIMRQTPFDSHHWELLPIYSFGDEIVQTMDLGGENDLYNFFYAKPRELSYQSAALSSSIPVWVRDDASIAVHGFNYLERTFNGINPAKSVASTIKFMSDRLAVWYKNNHNMLSGTFVIQGFPEPRVGCRAHYLDDDDRLWESYIQHVGQQFRALERYDTVLQVARGQEIPNERGAVPRVGASAVTA